MSAAAPLTLPKGTIARGAGGIPTSRRRDGLRAGRRLSAHHRRALRRERNWAAAEARRRYSAQRAVRSATMRVRAQTKQNGTTHLYGLCCHAAIYPIYHYI